MISLFTGDLTAVSFNSGDDSLLGFVKWPWSGFEDDKLGDNVRIWKNILHEHCLNSLFLAVLYTYIWYLLDIHIDSPHIWISFGVCLLAELYNWFNLATTRSNWWPRCRIVKINITTTLMMITITIATMTTIRKNQYHNNNDDDDNGNNKSNFNGLSVTL